MPDDTVRAVRAKRVRRPMTVLYVRVPVPVYNAVVRIADRDGTSIAGAATYLLTVGLKHDAPS